MTSAKEFIHVGNSVKLAKLYGCPKLQGTQKKCFWESFRMWTRFVEVKRKVLLILPQATMIFYGSFFYVRFFHIS